MSADRAEAARARLLEIVPEGFEERDDGGRVELAGYVDAIGEARLRAAFPTARSTPVASDWTERWRVFHTPVVAGGVWIGPSWETPPTGWPAVVIEPGRAFGTGAHPTTRLCVELLARLERGSLVDVGCGSGVLALVAARLGFAPLFALDVDPIAVEATRGNARANAIGLQTHELDMLAAELPATDVAVANVLLGPVLALLPRLQSPVAVTSGYLAGDEPAAPDWRRTDRLERDGWAADIHVRA